MVERPIPGSQPNSASGVYRISQTVRQPSARIRQLSRRRDIPMSKRTSLGASSAKSVILKTLHFKRRFYLTTSFHCDDMPNRCEGHKMSRARGNIGGRPAYRRQTEFREYPQRVVADAGSLGCKSLLAARRRPITI